ncbi:colicin immunity domain-containing protein [Desulfonema limicola]|nr:colicin immunity domain-containing protein [Desulfonema limicola]
MNPLINAYKDLIVLFAEKKEISALQFETKFLKLFKNDESCDENFYDIIKPLFYAVEDFCSNPDIRGQDDLDENQLTYVAKDTLEKLEKLYTADEKKLHPFENEYSINQLLSKLDYLINIFPLLIEATIEKKLDDILPLLLQETLSNELHNFIQLPQKQSVTWDIDTKYYTDKETIYLPQNMVYQEHSVYSETISY